MKLLILTILFLINSAQAQNENQNLSWREKRALKKANASMVGSSVGGDIANCVVTQYNDGKCRSQELFYKPGDESAKASTAEWFSRPVKANNPFAAANGFMKGDFDFTAPGGQSNFCMNCYQGLMKGVIKDQISTATNKDKGYFQSTLKQAFIEKQTENWAKRFQEIQNNISYMQLESKLHQLPKEEINAVAEQCNQEKVYKIITRFIDSQVKLAAEKGTATCPALKNVDVNIFKRIFRSKTKLETERSGTFKVATEDRMESLAINVKNQSTISCLNEGIFQKAYTFFSPKNLIRDFLSSDSEKRNDEKFGLLLIRSSLLKDPKYNFLTGDGKSEKILNNLSREIYSKYFDPLIANLNTRTEKALADNKKKAPNDQLTEREIRFKVLDDLEPFFDEAEQNLADKMADFDKANFNTSLSHLKNECDQLTSSHLEAVICHDPEKVNLTDIDLMSSLDTTPRLEDCIYNSDYNSVDLAKMTPFCAQYLDEYCATDPNAYKLSAEDQKYRKTLGAVHTKLRDFKSLRYNENDDELVKAKDDYEKKVCAPAVAEMKKKFPGLREGSFAYKKKLEELGMDQVTKLLTGSEAQSNRNSNVIMNRLAEYMMFEDDKNQGANSNIGDSSNKKAQGNEGSSSNVVSSTFGSSGTSESEATNSINSGGEDAPTYLGLEEGVSALVNGSGSNSEVVESDKEVVQANNQPSFNQNNPFNRNNSNSFNTPLPVRSSAEIKKDEQVLETNKTQISSMKQQLAERKESLGANYKNDPDYLAKEKKLKELEDKTRELERKLLAEKDQRIKELEKLLAGKNSNDKDYKKLYEELNRTVEARNTIASGGAISGGSLPSGIFAQNTSGGQGGNSQSNSSASGNSSQNGTGSSSYVSSGSSQNNSSNSNSSGLGVSGGGNYVSAQASKPNDVPVVTLTMEEFKSINQPNLDNARKAVEEILKKHNGSVIGNRLYVQIKDDKGNMVYHSIDLKILKTGEKLVVKKEDKKDEPKKIEPKKTRRQTATVEELNNVFK